MHLAKLRFLRSQRCVTSLTSVPSVTLAYVRCVTCVGLRRALRCMETPLKGAERKGRLPHSNWGTRDPAVEELGREGSKGKEGRFGWGVRALL